MNQYINELQLFLANEIELTVGKLEAKGQSEKNENPEQMLPKLLNAAMKNEWETSLLSCQWVVTERDLNFACLLARLAGDEAKHCMLIEKLVGKKFEYDGVSSPLFNYLSGLEDTFSRIVAGPFTRELLAIRRNELFLSYCQKNNFSEVLETYNLIQEEEAHHHAIGITLLDKLLVDENSFNQAKKIISETLQVVDDMQEMIMLKKGLHYLPGC